MSYILEDEKEFERLEAQSRREPYDYRRELERSGRLDRFAAARILDAGCGSGIVARYLAEAYPDATIIGYDASAGRVGRARERARALPNLSFEVQDLTALQAGDASFDAAVCRFVLQHLQPAPQRAVLAELSRCLAPGGQAVVIDVDGFLENLHPQTDHVATVIERARSAGLLDTCVGRKLPVMLAAAGFVDIRWSVMPMEFRGESLEAEIRENEARFAQAAPVMTRFLGSAAHFERFTSELFDCMRAPQAVLYYCKFVVTGIKPAPPAP